MARMIAAMLAMPRLPAVMATLCPGRTFLPNSSRASWAWTSPGTSSTRVASKVWRRRKIWGKSVIQEASYHSEALLFKSKNVLVPTLRVETHPSSDAPRWSVRQSTDAERQIIGSVPTQSVGTRGKRPVEPIPRRGYNKGNQPWRGAAMGIRFYCPNGHKLNVKQFQAGRTGICPRCGVTMPIPLESTRRSSRRERTAYSGEYGPRMRRSRPQRRPNRRPFLHRLPECRSAGRSGQGGVVRAAAVGRAVWAGRRRSHARLAGRGPHRRRCARVARRLARLAAGRQRVSATVAATRAIPGLESIDAEPLVTPLHPHHAPQHPPPRRSSSSSSAPGSWSWFCSRHSSF